MKKYKRGYTQGVYDMFHVGHLNLINNAKQYCEYLIVAVNSDNLVQEYKYKKPVIYEEDRRLIVENIKAVDEAVIVSTLDKLTQLQRFRFDAIFIGNDWKGNLRWEQTKKELAIYGVELIFLPYTESISSSGLRLVKDNKINER